MWVDRRRALVAMACALLLACGASIGEGPTGDGGQDAADGMTGGSCAAFARALCRRRFECTAPAYTVGHGFGDAFGTEARCVERVQLACGGWAALPGTRVTPTELQRCTDHLLAIDCRTSTQTLSHVTGRCGLERGTLAASAPCESGLQCESGSCTTQAGEPRCSPNSPPRAAPQVGASCDTGCGDDLVCGDTTCVAPALEGEPCDPDMPLCAPYAEIECDEASRTCVALGTSTGMCGFDTATQRRTACAEGECVGKNDFGRGHCSPHAADGEACNGSAGPTCLYPALCDEGRCVVPGL